MKLDRLLRALPEEFRRLKRMEIAMGALKNEIDNLTRLVQDVHDDVKARNTQVDAEDQAALGELKSKLDALDAEVGDADGSDTVQTAEQTPGTEPERLV